jgi:predicted transcriptional regulator of viral defense system
MITLDITRQTLNTTDTYLLTALSQQGQDVFTSHQAAAVLGCTPAEIRKRLHYLVKKGWLRRLEKGKYLILPLSAGPTGEYTLDEWVVAAHLVDPYYISYWSALRYYGYSEQAGLAIYLITTRRKQPLKVGGVVYRFITVQPYKLFGAQRIWLDGQAVYMAEREKALVDCLDRLDLCGGVVEAAKAVWRGRNEMDWSKVHAYGRQMGNSAILKRLGFLLELFELGNPDLLASMQGALGAGYSALDTLFPAEGRHNSRWRLIVNLPERELLEWRES